MDGEKWLFTRRQKTETPTWIPLLPQVVSTIDKYAERKRTKIVTFK
jgi:hypothetical protein